MIKVLILITKFQKQVWLQLKIWFWNAKTMQVNILRLFMQRLHVVLLTIQITHIKKTMKMKTWTTENKKTGAVTSTMMNKMMMMILRGKWENHPLKSLMQLLFPVQYNLKNIGPNSSNYFQTDSWNEMITSNATSLKHSKTLWKHQSKLMIPQLELIYNWSKRDLIEIRLMISIQILCRIWLNNTKTKIFGLRLRLWKLLVS